MKTSDDSNAALWRAYPDTKVDFWDENFVDGEYIIAYEMDPDLHLELKRMLPKVLFLLLKLLNTSDMGSPAYKKLRPCRKLRRLHA